MTCTMGLAFLLTVALAVGSPAGAAPAAVGRIVVRGAATIDGDTVRLGDIADIEGEIGADLSTLEIGEAPAPGATRTWSGTAILERLRARGVDLAAVRYVIPPVVHIGRRAQEVSIATVRALVEEHLARQLEPMGPRARVRAVEVPTAVVLAPGRYETRIRSAREVALTGRAPLVVEFVQNGLPVATVNVTAQIDVFEDVYVARRGIARGAIIGSEDVVVEQRETSALPRGVVRGAADVIGMEARTAIGPLAPLRHDQLGVPAVVRRGDVVTLLVESSGLRISTKAEVREDAPHDGQVRVWNLGSGAEVVGRVVDARTVAVSF